MKDTWTFEKIGVVQDVLQPYWDLESIALNEEKGSSNIFNLKHCMELKKEIGYKNNKQI